MVRATTAPPSMVKAAKRVAAATAATIKPAAKSFASANSFFDRPNMGLRPTVHNTVINKKHGTTKGRDIYCPPIKGRMRSFVFTTYYFRKKDKCVLLAIQIETVD